jgi:cytochrome c-type biogenesis protein CcmH
VTRRRRFAATLAVLVVVGLAVVGLIRAAAPAGNPSMAARVDAVATTLRCPTCHGLSVAESSSVLAAGSRSLIRQQLEQGRSPAQIRQYFVDRYGEEVLLSPSSGGAGLLVWALPGAVVVGAALVVWRWTRRRRRLPEGGDDARDALVAHRAGNLGPDDSPAGDALAAALAARTAAEEDGDDALIASADARLGAAYRRYRARPAPHASEAPGWTVPRRALLAGTAVLVVGVAGAGVAVAARDRGAGDPLTGDAVASVSSAPASSASATSAPASSAASVARGSAEAMASPPPGWTGGMPQTPDEWVSLGRAYDAAGRYDRAVAAYDMALEAEPTADAVVLLRADVLVRSGHPDQALPDLRRLYASYPDNSDVLLILGLAENRTGDAAGDATLRKFLALAPDSPAAPGVRRLLGEG